MSAGTPGTAEVFQGGTYYIQCPFQNCLQSYNLKKSQAGKRLKCPACQQTFLVIVAPAKPAAPPGSGTEAESSSPGTVTYKESQSELYYPDGVDRIDEARQRQSNPLARKLIPAVSGVLVVLLALVAVKHFRHGAGKKNSGHGSGSDSGDIGNLETSPFPNGSLVLAARKRVPVTDDETPVLTARKGQPMLVRGYEGGKVEVEVFTPESRVRGWVSERGVRKIGSSPIAASDILGYARRRPRRHRKPIKKISFRQDGRFFCTVAAAEPTVNVWTASNGILCRTYSPTKESSLSACFLSDGSILSTTAAGSSARAWDPLTTATLRRVSGIGNDFQASASGRSFVVSSNGSVSARDARGNLPAIAGPLNIEGMRFRPSDSYDALLLWTTLPEFTAYLLPSLRKDVAFPLPEPAREVSADSHGARLAMLTQDGKHLLLLGPREHSVTGSLSLHRAGNRIRFFGQDRFLALAFANSNRLGIFAVGKTLRPLLSLVVKDGDVITALASSPDGNTLAAGCSNGQVKGWPATSRAESALAQARANRDIAQVYREFQRALNRGNHPQARKILQDLQRDYGQHPRTAAAAREYSSSLLKESKKLYRFFRNFLLNSQAEKAQEYLGQLEREFPGSSFTRKAKQELDIWKKTHP